MNTASRARSYYNGKQAENISSYCASLRKCISYLRQQGKVVDKMERSRNRSRARTQHLKVIKCGKQDKSRTKIESLLYNHPSSSVPGRRPRMLKREGATIDIVLEMCSPEDIELPLLGFTVGSNSRRNFRSPP